MSTGRERLAPMLAATLVAAAVSIHAQSGSPEAPPTFRSAVELVTIQASVRDTRGRVVHGLTSADFEVRDNGQLRPIVELRSDRQSPVTVAILVDMSGSMSVGSKIALARQTFESMLGRFRQGDTVAVYAFDSSLHELRGFTHDVSRLAGALAHFEPFGATSLYDAADATARRLAERSATHRAIVVLTDGVDTSSTLTAAEVSGLASSIDVPVYIVATVPSIDQRSMLEAAGRSPDATAADLRDLAEWTGGQLFFATTDPEAMGVASSIIDELRQQYVLAIEAAEVREWRRLDVRVRKASTTVKARSGYFGG